MSETIKNRYDFMILFDVERGNPNGDPDADGMPRVDPETGYGLVTNVCINRKLRNYVLNAKEGLGGYDMYIKEGSILNHNDKEAYTALNAEDVAAARKSDPDFNQKVRDYMCRNYYDVRTFGAVMTTHTSNVLPCGRLKGPVHITMAQSVDPITPLDISITRCALTTEADAKDKLNTMGRQYVVPYALYVATGSICANDAKKTGFTEDDLELLWEAILNMFEDDHSSSRGQMALRELIIFKHENKLGSADTQRHKLFEKVHIEHSDSFESVPRKYSDYKVTIDSVPEGITLIRKS